MERRELGIINVGETGIVRLDGTAYTLENQEALYVGRGAKDVVFENTSGSSPLFLAMIVALLLVTYIPALSLWLPSIFDL